MPPNPIPVTYRIALRLQFFTTFGLGGGLCGGISHHLLRLQRNGQLRAELHSVLAGHNQRLQSIPGKSICVRVKNTRVHPVGVHATFYPQLTQPCYPAHAPYAHKFSRTQGVFGYGATLIWGSRLGWVVICRTQRVRPSAAFLRPIKNAHTCAECFYVCMDAHKT